MDNKYYILVDNNLIIGAIPTVVSPIPQDGIEISEETFLLIMKETLPLEFIMIDGQVVPNYKNNEIPEINLEEYILDLEFRMSMIELGL